MKVLGKDYRTIWVDPDNPQQICIIDQRLLPEDFVIVQISSCKQMGEIISEMYVRGAGLIGAAGGFGAYLATLEAPDTGFDSYVTSACEQLAKSRPTARNLAWAINRVLDEISTIEGPDAKRRCALRTACEIADEDAEYCRRIGEHGRELIRKIAEKKNGEPVNILTHCNAGWLAFVDYGSATAPIYSARDARIPVHIWVDETRPWNQGARLTTWELGQEGIDHTLICDNCGGHLMQQGMVDMVLVGTDRTTYTGDVANKIGTYLKALAAKDNNIPFYVALPSSTFDWELDSGGSIPIEQRREEEITTLSGNDQTGTRRTISLAPRGTRAINYSFDVTPARLVTGLITERGIVKPDAESILRLFQRPRPDSHTDKHDRV